MKWNTPICKVDENENTIYIKREDLIPYSFGGNKARKAFLFFEEIDSIGADYIVTYGSACSNHCRVVANMACERKIPCIIVSPSLSKGKSSYNEQMMEIFHAQIVECPVNEVHQKIEDILKGLRRDGFCPYFIAGGGHGNIGTQAYIDCYEEICEYEKSAQMKFDYIFHASGTGTTQAGLVCGQLINGDNRKIVGISIAREETYGRNIVIESVREYLNAANMKILEQEIQKSVIFDSSYIGGGYGEGEEQINDVINNMLTQKGIPMDRTYTGKAYYGMNEYIKKSNMRGQKILFIHTGGTPLFFDYLHERVFEDVNKKGQGVHR